MVLVHSSLNLPKITEPRIRLGIRYQRIDEMTMPTFNQAFADFRLRDHELILEPNEVVLHPVHKVPTYFFRMVDAGSNEQIGGINLRAGFSAHIELYAGHIGYSVAPAHRGHRYASRAIRLLLPIARGLQLNPLWITCDPENIASRRSCELAGAELVEIVNVPATCIIFQAGHPRKCRYRLILDH
jgi:predicted acetyltransferase